MDNHLCASTDGKNYTIKEENTAGKAADGNTTEKLYNAQLPTNVKMNLEVLETYVVHKSVAFTVCRTEWKRWSLERRRHILGTNCNAVARESICMVDVSPRCIRMTSR